MDRLHQTRVLESGFLHIILLLSVMVLASLLTFVNVQLYRSVKQESSNVAGVGIAEGDRGDSFIDSYEISDIRQQKLLGFIPVTYEVKMIVSAQTGELLKQQQTALSQIINLLSF